MKYTDVKIGFVSVMLLFCSVYSLMGQVNVKEQFVAGNLYFLLEKSKYKTINASPCIQFDVSCGYFLTGIDFGNVTYNDSLVCYLKRIMRKRLEFNDSINIQNKFFKVIDLKNDPVLFDKLSLEENIGGILLEVEGFTANFSIYKFRFCKKE